MTFIKQIKKIYAGAEVTCPKCGSKNIKAELYRTETGVGFGDILCNDCGNSEHLCRVRFPENVKVKIIDV